MRSTTASTAKPTNSPRARATTTRSADLASRPPPPTRTPSDTKGITASRSWNALPAPHGNDAVGGHPDGLDHRIQRQPVTLLAAGHDHHLGEDHGDRQDEPHGRSPACLALDEDLAAELRAASRTTSMPTPSARHRADLVDGGEAGNEDQIDRGRSSQAVGGLLGHQSARDREGADPGRIDPRAVVANFDHHLIAVALAVNPDVDVVGVFPVRALEPRPSSVPWSMALRRTCSKGSNRSVDDGLVDLLYRRPPSTSRDTALSRERAVSRARRWNRANRRARRHQTHLAHRRMQVADQPVQLGLSRAQGLTQGLAAEKASAWAARSARVHSWR